MALKILVNHAWAGCADFLVTNGSDVETADTLTRNMVGGARHLTFTQAGTAGLRIVYVNKSAKLSFDTFVMVNASRHLGHAFQLVSWATYTGTLTQHVNESNWAPTLVNGGRDYVEGGFSASNVDALGIVLDSGSGGAYTKTLNQLYFSTAFTLPYFGSMSMTPTWTAVAVGRQRYHVDERRALVIPGLTKTQKETLLELPNLRTQPFFIWDDSGDYFSENLYHCVCTSLGIAQEMDELYTASFELYRLRRYV